MSVERPSARRNRFSLFGFEVFKGVFTPFRSRVFDELDAVLPTRRSPTDTAGRRTVPDVLGRSPALAEALSRAGLEDMAADLLDTSVVPVYGEAGEYPGETCWHTGTEVRSPRLVTFVLHDRRPDTPGGALCVLPGSHRNPSAYPTGIVAAAEIPGHVPDVGPGDVIALDPRMRRSVRGGQAGRRITVTYAGRPDGPAARRELESTRLAMADRTVAAAPQGRLVR
ncbi:hypothetical protein [Streptomyces sp. NPDC127033]|uniref:hypothetical protein n=1 Tax=Streptomyces sp. NPDC127033 TaxID=3347110 RepID=UPI0036565A45